VTWLGRFASEDPKEFDAGDENLYRYVGNGPVNASDPTGCVEDPFYTYMKGEGHRDPRVQAAAQRFREDLDRWPAAKVRQRDAELRQQYLWMKKNVPPEAWLRITMQGMLQNMGAAIRETADDLSEAGVDLVASTGSETLSYVVGFQIGVSNEGAHWLAGAIDCRGSLEGLGHLGDVAYQVGRQEGWLEAGAWLTGMAAYGEAYYGYDVLTFKPVDPLDKIREGTSRLTFLTGTAAGIATPFRPRASLSQAIAADARSLQTLRALETDGLLAAPGEVPPAIYREGRPSPSNLTPRPQDNGYLSFRDSLSNPVEPGVPGPPGGRPVFRPGEEYMRIDTSKLPPGTVIPDGVPPGHVSVRNVPPEVLKNAVTPKPPKPPYGPDASGKFPK
jgi:hypothetical protein